MELLKAIFSGTNIAIFGAALATLLSGMGSAKAVGLVGEATNGLMTEDPDKFGKALILEALPMTQGLYGFVTGFLILVKINVFGEMANLTVSQGAYFFMAALPIAIVGYYSALKQGRVASTGISLISKRPDEVGKAITSAVLVETYAIFAVLVSLLLVLFAQV